MNNNPKHKVMKKIFKLFIISILILIIFNASFFIYAIATDYHPPKQETISKNNYTDTIINQTFSVLTWNVGYCGLDETMDFFYDGGEKVRSTRQSTLNNLKNIINFITERDTIDFILLQEVDKFSKRSYFTNQFDSLKTKLTNYIGTFALNYNVKYIPFPLLSPLGKIKAGLATFSKIKPSLSTRYSFPGNYSMPKKLFLLDRCFLVNKYKLKNSKNLIIINTHNSAYDKGNLKQQQMQYLKKYIINEYNKGNYIIVGGDWNQLPPKFSVNNFTKLQTKNIILKNIDNNFLPDSWKWIFDRNLPTNRSLEKKYSPGKTYTTIIDFFVISPNITNIFVKTINLKFKNSDHQPIIASFKIKI